MDRPGFAPGSPACRAGIFLLDDATHDGQAGRLRPSDLLRPVQVRCLAALQPGTGQGSGFRPRGLRHGAPALWLAELLPDMARPVGFEPTTLCFSGTCSSSELQADMVAETGFAPVSRAYETRERPAALLRDVWSHTPGLNRQPSLYKSAARPVVLVWHWHERKDLNLHRTVLETDALPLSYARVMVELAGFEPALTAFR